MTVKNIPNKEADWSGLTVARMPYKNPHNGAETRLGQGTFRDGTDNVQATAPEVQLKPNTRSHDGVCCHGQPLLMTNIVETLCSVRHPCGGIHTSEVIEIGCMSDDP
jgi:hypothetical protein